MISVDIYSAVWEITSKMPNCGREKMVCSKQGQKAVRPFLRSTFASTCVLLPLLVFSLLGLLPFHVCILSSASPSFSIT